MTKLNRILLVLLALQTLLILGMRVGGKQEGVIQSVKVLDPFDPAKVTNIKIAGAPQEKPDAPPQNSVELARLGAGWGIATADAYPADKSKVDTFLETLSKLKSRETVLTKATYHKKLEVTEEVYQRKVTLTHDGKDLTFYVGSSPALKTVHVRLDGEANVLLVPDFAVTDVGDRAWSWVDRTYIKFGRNDVWAVNVTNKNGSFIIEKNPDNQEWQAPHVVGELEKSKVNNIVSRASTVNMESPVGKGVKPEHGLADPLATVTLITGTSTIAGVPPPTTHQTVIKVGTKLEKENRYYLKSDKNDYVVKVAAWAVKDLVETKPDDLVKKPPEEKK